MDLETYALVTLDNAKDFLSITSSSKDALLTMLINQSTDFIETYCQRRFANTIYTQEEYDGTKSKILQLNQYPVISFTLLEWNSATDNTDSWEEIDADDYWIDEDEGHLTKTTLFVRGKQNYRATYEAGYASIPHDLQFACLSLVSEILNRRKASGISSESLGDHSVTFTGALMKNKTIETILANYRSIYI